jgi:hypothetical protein
MTCLRSVVVVDCRRSYFLENVFHTLAAAVSRGADLLQEAEKSP